MDEDGSAESGRTRLARGTKPHAPLGEPERTNGASADAAVPAAVAPRGGDDARVRSALLTAPARAGSLPSSLGTARRAVRASEAPDPGHAGLAPTDVGTTDVGTTDVGTTDVGTTDVGTTDVGTTDGRPVSAGVERSEMAGGDPDGSVGEARSNAPRGIERSEMAGGDPDGSVGEARSNAPRGIERSEMAGGDPDGSVGGAGGSAPHGIAARGSGPVPVGGAPGGAGRAPAQSICEAVEQLIEAQEADEAIAEWMQGDG